MLAAGEEAESLLDLIGVINVGFERLDNTFRNSVFDDLANNLKELD